MSKNRLIRKITSGFLVNSNRKHLHDFADDVANSVPACSMVLDAGAVISFYYKIGALFLLFYFGNADLKKKHSQSGHCKNYCLVAKISAKNEAN